MNKFFKNFKIYDKEPCPCGSEKEYVNCCKNRKDKPTKKSKKPLNVQIMEQFRKSQIKCCLYPDKTRCHKHIKEAHALQNSKIISLLAEEGHVYILNPNKAPEIIPIENEEPEVLVKIDRVGVNHATTATCFCDVHDDEVFAPIEKCSPDFNKDSDEHKYIYAYKTFIFEYYRKLVEQKIFRKNLTDKPSLLKSFEYVQQYRAITTTLKEMDEVKNFFDKGILNNNYSGLETCVIELQESINFADYACLALDFDMNGKKIKNSKNGFISRLFITIFPEETKSYIILSCLKSDYKIYKRFFEQLKNTNTDKVKYFLNLILPLYSENIVISPRLWEQWSDNQQLAYTFYANRQGKQFLIYRQILKWGMRNLKNKEQDFGDGNRGIIDLFQKIHICDNIRL